MRASVPSPTTLQKQPTKGSIAAHNGADRHKHATSNGKRGELVFAAQPLYRKSPSNARFTPGCTLNTGSHMHNAFLSMKSIISCVCIEKKVPCTDRGTTG